MVNSTDFSDLTPILHRGNAGPQFLCGFCCNYNATECFLAVLLYHNRFNGQNDMINKPQLVWSANGNHPVKANATLKLGQDGNLALTDSDGTIVWSTGTIGKSVSGLNLTEMGNLVLFDKRKRTIWQSFDHPTDSSLQQPIGVRICFLLVFTMEAGPFTQYHSFIELKNTTYFSFNVDHKLILSILWLEGKKLEDCKRACLSNCSCNAAVFEYDWNGNQRGRCLLLNEVFSLIDNEGGRGHKVFLKVQNPSKAHTQSPIILGEMKSRPFKVIIGSTLAAFLGIILSISTCFVIFKKWAHESRKAGDFLDLEPILPGILTRFSYNELKIITDDFSRKLGEGGFGSVDEGTPRNGTKIAVKHLDGLGQVKESFLTEVKTVGGIHHINLVKLIGFCVEKSHRLLIYDYMVNGSLDRWITHGKQENGLTWQTRQRIISDIAKGLAYLHGDCSHKIIHLDIKPQNILLDQYFNAKKSDLGLSKLIEKDKS
ncbi:putative G-type lectin S-receptor-like serine/threonine-protein kinase SD2-5-like [Capsicum annuum]|nr:putative G-type lectin S-receptor-like serine/threonine-protein kinase SD2-5-like [Capsicum annuum]